MYKINFVQNLYYNKLFSKIDFKNKLLILQGFLSLGLRTNLFLNSFFCLFGIIQFIYPLKCNLSNKKKNNSEVVGVH